jgi:hypothetical protein
VPYIILGIPLVVFLFRICREKQGGWQFLATACLAIILAFWLVLDTGLIGRHVVKMGDKEFLISSNAFEEVIARNIDNLGEAIANVYEKFYVVEVFDLTKQDRRVKFSLENGTPICQLALKYSAVSNTISAMVSEGQLFYVDKDSGDDENFYKLTFSKLKSVQEAIDLVKKMNLKIQVKYFKK